MKNPAKTMITLIISLLSMIFAHGQNVIENPELDKKVQEFLDKNSGKWSDMNVPPQDGKTLHAIILQNHYQSALEIGTSTGLSSIWIAWALSKTGGKLITIEIDEKRYRKALNNFKEAGLLKYIDARRADAHDLINKLNGPFDFIFSDADKEWYQNYFIALDPKLKVNGCYISHNVSDNHFGHSSPAYLEFLRKLPNYETSVNNDGAGMAISYKRHAK